MKTLSVIFALLIAPVATPLLGQPSKPRQQVERADTTEGNYTASSSPDAQVITLGDAKPVGIRPGQSRLWGFEIGTLSSSCLAMGQIETISGGDKNVSVVIVRQSDYKDWTENRPVRTEYESGERTVVAFDVSINDAGHYVLVVSNSSRTASKVVQLQHVTVTCVK
ncbi:MAG TPA: hypothetical protein VJS39_08725 [Gemmatimonadaceae bacterium]|nr:hypothetical protein [Gemmatimonadaceae bacterium]